MAETDPIFPGEQRTSASGCGFFFVFLVGAAAVFIAFKREVGTPSIWLELGAGTMLFVVLYWVERRLVRNETERLMETFTGNIEQLEEMAATLQRADTVDHSESGPAEIASKWLYAMRHGHFETAWNLSDPSWRLCRAQAWLWNNPRTTAQYGDRDRIAQPLRLVMLIIRSGFPLSRQRLISSDKSGETLTPIPGVLPLEGVRPEGIMNLSFSRR
jgi:hypothetical protein